MKVYCGTIVHCRTPERIQVLSNHVIGFEEKDSGRVSIETQVTWKTVFNTRLKFIITLILCPIQIAFVEHVSRLVELCQDHNFDKDEVHHLSERLVGSYPVSSPRDIYMDMYCSSSLSCLTRKGLQLNSGWWDNFKTDKYDCAGEWGYEWRSRLL